MQTLALAGRGAGAMPRMKTILRILSLQFCKEKANPMIVRILQIRLELIGEDHRKPENACADGVLGWFGPKVQTTLRVDSAFIPARDSPNRPLCRVEKKGKDQKDQLYLLRQKNST